MSALELRRRLAARLVAAHSASTSAYAREWSSLPPVPSRPGELRLHGANEGPAVLIGTDLASARNSIGSLSEQATSSALSLSVRATPLGFLTARRYDEAMLRRGGDARGVVDVWAMTAAVHSVLSPEQRALLRVGCVTQQMIIYDDTALVVDGPAVAGERTTWLLIDRELVALARRVFEFTWREARPLEQAEAAKLAIDALTPRQRQIAELLLAGRSESAIGRALHISARTVAYEVTAMLQALGAAGRVELGYRLRQLEETRSG